MVVVGLFFDKRKGEPHVQAALAKGSPKHSMQLPAPSRPDFAQQTGGGERRGATFPPKFGPTNSPSRPPSQEEGWRERLCKKEAIKGLEDPLECFSKLPAKPHHSQEPQ